MSRWFVAAFAFGLVLVLGYALWYSRRFPREIIGTSEIRLTVDGVSRALRTRDVSINGVVFREVEMPGGTWMPCHGDCAAAARDAGAGFWEKQGRERR